jgi:hypothetical protein
MRPGHAVRKCELGSCSCLGVTVAGMNTLVGALAFYEPCAPASDEQKLSSLAGKPMFIVQGKSRAPPGILKVTKARRKEAFETASEFLKQGLPFCHGHCRWTGLYG